MIFRNQDLELVDINISNTGTQTEYIKQMKIVYGIYKRDAMIDSRQDETERLNDLINKRRKMSNK